MAVPAGAQDNPGVISYGLSGPRACAGEGEKNAGEGLLNLTPNGVSSFNWNSPQISYADVIRLMGVSSTASIQLLFGIRLATGGATLATNRASATGPGGTFGSASGTERSLTPDTNYVVILYTNQSGHGSSNPFARLCIKTGKNFSTANDDPWLSPYGGSRNGCLKPSVTDIPSCLCGKRGTGYGTADPILKQSAVARKNFGCFDQTNYAGS
ncbi:MAG: hypothetical protein OXC57_15155 [Rhodobacteraceae bacterium]|nr:hypothetical protein [Paracoccaceae bacterium]